MKRQIRRAVFETNSSSVHTLTMCMKADYDLWVAGELVLDDWYDKLVEITPEIEAEMGGKYSRYLTYEEFHDWRYCDYEHFEKTYKTTNNQEIVAFGYYGHD